MFFVYLVVAAIVVVLVASGVLAWLWNMTMPELFALKPLDYWQAFRLILIAGILFSPGGFVKFGT